MAEPLAGKPDRIPAIDQLRGYAIFGMLLVNSKVLFFDAVAPTVQGSSIERFWGALLGQLSHHRESFSYADTVAPLFVFVVGMGMRLSWLRRSEAVGAGQTRKAMVKRYTLLVLIAFAIYAGWLWDALMDIGLAGLLAVMLIDKRPRTRIAAAFAFVVLYQAMHMFTSYGVWSVNGRWSLQEADYIPLLVRLIPSHGELFGATLNGGPLGPLSWCMMLLLGSVAYDLMKAGDEKKFVTGARAWGVGLCAAGYALHIEWPGLKQQWPFSARYMTAPFPLWSTGLCFLHLLAFWLICSTRI